MRHAVDQIVTERRHSPLTDAFSSSLSPSLSPSPLVCLYVWLYVCLSLSVSPSLACHPPRNSERSSTSRQRGTRTGRHRDHANRRRRVSDVVPTLNDAVQGKGGKRRGRYPAAPGEARSPHEPFRSPALHGPEEITLGAATRADPSRGQCAPRPLRAVCPTSSSAEFLAPLSLFFLCLFFFPPFFPEPGGPACCLPERLAAFPRPLPPLPPRASLPEPDAQRGWRTRQRIGVPRAGGGSQGVLATGRLDSARISTMSGNPESAGIL